MPGSQRDSGPAGCVREGGRSEISFLQNGLEFTVPEGRGWSRDAAGWRSRAGTGERGQRTNFWLSLASWMFLLCHGTWGLLMRLLPPSWDQIPKNSQLRGMGLFCLGSEGCRLSRKLGSSGRRARRLAAQHLSSGCRDVNAVLSPCSTVLHFTTKA